MLMLMLNRRRKQLTSIIFFSPILTLEKPPPETRIYNDLVNYSLYHPYAQIIET